MPNGIPRDGFFSLSSLGWAREICPLGSPFIISLQASRHQTAILGTDFFVNAREDGIEKSIPWDHRLSSFFKPHDTKRRFSEQIFSVYPSEDRREKCSFYPCEIWIEKSVPWDHRLSSYCKPWDTKWRFPRRFFLPILLRMG